MFEIISGKYLSNSQYSGATTSITVSLTHVIDLCEAAEHLILATSSQELTGHWRGYQTRTMWTSVKTPVGAAPTQELGEAIYNDGRRLEGFRFASSKNPAERILAVFPNHMRIGSIVTYSYPDGRGGTGQRNHPRPDAMTSGRRHGFPKSPA